MFVRTKLTRFRNLSVSANLLCTHFEFSGDGGDKGARASSPTPRIRLGYRTAECLPLFPSLNKTPFSIAVGRYQDVLALRLAEAIKAQNGQGLIAPYRRPLKFRER